MRVMLRGCPRYSTRVLWRIEKFFLKSGYNVLINGMLVEYGRVVRALSRFEEEHMKAKRILMAAVVLATMVFSSCVLAVKGDVYIGYGWDSFLAGFYDENPSVPYFLDIVEDRYYYSRTGDYDGWYTWENSLATVRATYYFRYSLDADYTNVDDPYGPYDAYFYIYLDSSGPVYYSPSYSRSLDGEQSGGKVVTASSSSAAPISEVDKNSLGEPDGVIEKSQGGYTMHLEYWKIE